MNPLATNSEMLNYAKFHLKKLAILHCRGNSRTNEHSRKQTNKLSVLYFIKWTSWHWNGVHVVPLFDWLWYFGFNPAGLGSVWVGLLHRWAGVLFLWLWQDGVWFVCICVCLVCVCLLSGEGALPHYRISWSHRQPNWSAGQIPLHAN